MKDTLTAMRAKGVHFGIVSGSDLSKVTEQLTEEVVTGADWCFSENGLFAFKNGAFLEKQSLEDFLGKDKLERLVNYCLDYIGKLDIPVKTSNHVEQRAGMINVSPIGRACSREERNAFEEYDHVHNIRKQMVALLQ